MLKRTFFACVALLGAIRDTTVSGIAVHQASPSSGPEQLSKQEHATLAQTLQATELAQTEADLPDFFNFIVEKFGMSIDKAPLEFNMRGSEATKLVKATNTLIAKMRELRKITYVWERSGEVNLAWYIMVYPGKVPYREQRKFDENELALKVKEAI